MTIAIISVVIWAIGVSMLLKLRFVRNRPDAYPLVAIWPLLGFYVLFILLYEGVGIAIRSLRDLRS